MLLRSQRILSGHVQWRRAIHTSDWPVVVGHAAISSSSPMPPAGPATMFVGGGPSSSHLLVSSIQVGVGSALVSTAGPAGEDPFSFQSRRLSILPHTSLTVAQSVVRPQLVSKRGPTLSRTCELNDIMKSRTLLISSTVLSNLESRANRDSNSWRSAEAF